MMSPSTWVTGVPRYLITEVDGTSASALTSNGTNGNWAGSSNDHMAGSSSDARAIECTHESGEAMTDLKPKRTRLRIMTKTQTGGDDGTAKFERTRLNRKTKAEVADASKRATKAAKKETLRAWSDALAASSNADAPKRTRFSAVHEVDIHPTHERWKIRDITFCGKCGYWKQLRSKSLRNECMNVPSHHNAKYNLNRMMRGLHPRPAGNGAQWDDGTPTTVVFPPERLD